MWIKIFCYILMTFGFSVIVTQSYGPKNIFFRLRLFAESVGPNFGMLFKCITCFPTNLGIILSLFNWFLIPNELFTPFNIIFENSHDVWYMAFIAALFDGCLTGGIVRLIWNVDDFIDKSTPIFEDAEYNHENKLLMEEEL